MDIEDVRSYCLRLPHCTEDMPFGPEVLVFRVGGKIFALLPLDKPGKINLKSDPVQAIEWRATYPEIEPGYHMNKTHWNTVDYEGRLKTKFICEMISHSYDLIYKSLTKKQKDAISAEH